MVVGQGALERYKASALQDDLAARVGDDFFFQAIAPLQAGVGQPVGRRPFGQVGDHRPRVALLLREEPPPSATTMPMSRVQAWSTRGK